MKKELFNEFDENDFFYDKSNEEKSDQRKDDILEGLAKELTDADIGYLVARWMEYNDKSVFASREYDEDTGNKLIHFRMQAEFGYYLDDIE